MTDRSAAETCSSQKTLADSVELEGTGLHTGRPVTATLVPQSADTGLVFRRMDVEGEPAVTARVENVVGVEWETVIANADTRVRMIEHLLAALAAARVDNVEVQLEGPEPPALDGRAVKWCEAIKRAGVRDLDEPAPELIVHEPFVVEEGDSRYMVGPYPRYRVSAEIEFDHPAIGRQFASASVDETFCQEVGRARTFGLERWRDDLHSRGLALGASTDNTVVVGETELASGTELRYPNEFARHKLIDLVGDLALLGTRLRAHVTAEKPGHRGNIALARRLRELQNGGDSGPVLDIHEILEYIPHRYPLLLVDRVLEFEAGKRIVGLKNVTMNEPFFTGHFPEHPIMPGVLIVEAMAQVGGLLLMNEFENPEDKVVYFMSLDGVKWRKPVIPGDQLIFELEMIQLRGRVCRMRGVGSVDGKTVAEATMMARVVDR